MTENKSAPRQFSKTFHMPSA